ncbi:unnamed protein product [Alopecurus aequalis]
MLVSSAGTYPEILEQEISMEFPVHTFALGYHCPREMKYLADMTSGTYSYIDLDTDIKYALALFLTGLTSAVATCIKITLQVHEEVTISSIKSGGSSNFVSLDKRSGTIDIYNIYAGEQKNFMVTLIVPQDKEKQKLMTVGGRYQNLNARKELASMDVIVLRSRRGHYLPDELVIHPKVAAEILWIQYMKGILDIQNKDVSGYSFIREHDMSGHWQETHVVPEEMLLDLEKDIAEIHKGNKKYILSWLRQQHADEGTNLVKVEGFTRSNAIMFTGTSNEFPVLVRVAVAPWHHAEEMPRAGVDIVAMLDVSRSMQGERLERMKQAMMIVIDKLGPNDRLSILSLQTHTHQLTKLTYMSDDQGRGWDAARLKISELETSNGSDMGHITGGTLLQGARILRSRGADESRSRLGCMIFLSDLRQCPEIFRIQLSPEFPVHTFGLGADHKSKVMKYIADETSGTYSFINQDISNLKYALRMFITGLTSIAVSSIQITVRAHFGIAISSIESGGYIHHVKSDKMSGTINFNHIYAGEQKDFIVNLTVGTGRTELLTIGGQYQRLNRSKSLPQIDLSVLGPCSTCSLDKMAIHHDVAAELTRTQLQKGVSAMLEKKHLTAQDLQNMWDIIKDSDNGHSTPEKTLYGLSMDVAEMKRDVSGLDYMLSWLSCHKWQRATTKGTPNNSSAFRTIGQHTDEGGSMVKVETFTRSKEIPSENTCNKFPVLMCITAAPRRLAKEMPHAGVDIVAVLDVSGKMRGKKLDHMKQALMFVIDKLGADDRLSIVSFNTYENRLMKLTYMSDQDRDVAKLRINKLVARGQNDMGAGLREGAQILLWRGACSHRVGCMMLLSDGKYPEIFQTELNSEFPVHTFGLGTNHNPNVMKYIADMTCGTYSFINQDIDRIKDALALFITGLRSVAAMSIKITLRTGEGITISSIESGGYINHVKSDNRSGTIEIDNIYASERKDFIVYLRVEKGKKELMTIGGRYLSHDTVKHLAYTDVYVQRPHQEGLLGNLAIQRDVAAELVRIRLKKGISAMLEQGPDSIELQQLWDGIIDSEEGRGAPEETLAGLSMDIAEMKRDIENPKEYRKTGLPYTLSWLSSHNWQRATTKDTPCSSGGIQTTGQDADGRTTLSHQPI